MKIRYIFVGLITALMICILLLFGFSGEIDILENKVIEANNKIFELNTNLEKVEKEKADISKQLDSANKTIENQKKTLAEVREQVTSLNSQLKTLKSNTQSGTSTTAKSATFSINGSYEVIRDNSVGNDWSCTYSIDGDGLCLGDTLIAAVGDVIKISVVVTENDNSPDTGSNSVTRTLSYDDIVHGFSTTLNVYVKENRGRYAGNTATVRVKLTFTPKH